MGTGTAKGNDNTVRNVAIVAAIGVLGYAGYKIYKQMVGGPMVVSAGDIPVLDFTWKNDAPTEYSGFGTIKPEFRLDEKPSSPPLDIDPISWVEGLVWVSSAGVEIGGEEKLRAVGKTIPGDWGGRTVDLKLVARIVGIMDEITVWSLNKAYSVTT